MIEITDGFTSISTGSDSIEAVEQVHAAPAAVRRVPRRPTGARVTVEFRRESSLLPGQRVSVRYDFADDGHVRQLTGIPTPIRTVVRQRRAVMYYYRLSHWIAAPALMDLPGDERPLPRAHRPIADRLRSEKRRTPMLTVVATGATAIDPSPA